MDKVDTLISINECHSAKERRAFERVPEVLHRGNPAFVPAFPFSIAKLLSPKSVFHRLHGTIRPFIACRGGRPVGRIAAIINRSHNEHHQDRVGFFGFFDCENDAETADLLFSKLREVLHAEGMESIRGPYNPTINHECGLLLERFDKPPTLGLTWNPAYYRLHLERVGFKCARMLYGFNLPMNRLEIPERVSRIVERMKKRSALKIRPFDFQNMESELRIVRDVYNATLERNWGFTPIAMEDMLATASEIRAIADPRILLIGESNGRPAGVALSLPNINEILAAVRNTPLWLRLAHIFLLLKTRKVHRARQTILGVVPEFRDRGLHAWLLHEQFRVAKLLHKEATLGWVEESNTEVLQNCTLFGGEHDGQWGIFEMAMG